MKFKTILLLGIIFIFCGCEDLFKPDSPESSRGEGPKTFYGKAVEKGRNVTKSAERRADRIEKEISE